MSVEFVTADGRCRNVSDDEDPDLFWALRGGGGNFGVAASFEFDAHPVTMITGGLIAFDLARRGSSLRFFRDFTADARPTSCRSSAASSTRPTAPVTRSPRSPVCHCGDAADGERALEAVRGSATPSSTCWVRCRTR